MKNAVHFGAGSIGKGFIADLLHSSGYHVTFLDVDEATIDEINSNGTVELRLIEHDYSVKVLDEVSALNTIQNPAGAVDLIAAADLVTTSVWANNLGRIAGLIADGLIERKRLGRPRINVIACENAMFASTALRNEILAARPAMTRHDLDSAAAFPNSAVDRVVLPGSHEGRPTIDVADYFELALERNALVEPGTEPIEGATYTDDLESYLVRKLYVVNCGHLWAGLLGKRNGLENVHSVFTDKNLVVPVYETMKESAKYVQQRYHFTAGEMDSYVAQSVRRYQSQGVDYATDMVTRSPIRKLSRSERFVGPALGCEDFGFPNDHLLEGIAMLLLSDNATDSEAVELRKAVTDEGPGKSLEKYSGIGSDSPLYSRIISHYYRLLDEQKAR